MADANLDNDSADAQKQNAPVEANVDVKVLQKELADTKELLEKARRGETHNRNQRKDLETKLAELEGSDYKSKYDATLQELTELKSGLVKTAVDQALTAAATAAGAKDIKAVLKLVERDSIEVKDGAADAKTIDAAIAKAKEEFSVLFEAPKTPDIKRPGVGNVTDTFKNELTAAKTKDEKLAVMKKYGIGTTI